LLDQWQLGMGLRRPENWDLSSESTHTIDFFLIFVTSDIKLFIKFCSTVPLLVHNAVHS